MRALVFARKWHGHVLALAAWSRALNLYYLDFDADAFGSAALAEATSDNAHYV
jgi:hypothetical protein